MKIRKNQIRDKCQSDKYYASIKYMAHSLHGKDRENIIINLSKHIGQKQFHAKREHSF